MSQTNKRPYAIRWILLLGLITALGPLSIDMYLPSLPAIADDFGVSTSEVSHSVTAYFLGLVVGQLIYGPLSDRIGRRNPLFIGLGLYLAASLLCLFADSVMTLNLARFVQALGGCAGVVIARAAIRDRLSNEQMSQAISMLILVMGVAPIVAPALGNLVLIQFSWQVIFLVLALFSVICLVWSYVDFEDTLPIEKRSVKPWSGVLGEYVELLKDKRFLLPAVASGMLMCALFVYINASAELLIDYFGLSSTWYSWVFGANAAGLIAMTQLSARLVTRFSVLKVFSAGVYLQVASATALLICTLLGLNHLTVVVGLIFVLLSGIGLTAPNGTTLALADQSERSGLASSMLGALQFFIGALGSIVLHSFGGDLLTRFSVALWLMMSAGLVLLLIYRRQVRNLSSTIKTAGS